MSTTFTRRSAMPASADDLFAWHARPAAFARLLPPWEDVRVVAVDGAFGDGQKVTVRTPLLGPVRTNWVAELFDVQPGRRFRDRQLSGPFAEWTHTHDFIPDGPDSSFLEDRIEYRLPLGGLVGNGLVKHRLEQLFAYRHAVTAGDLRRHAKFRDRLTVAVTGSGGLLGSDLCHFLAAGGHRVIRLVRGKPAPALDGTESRPWNPNEPVPPALFDGVDAVIHLAGENLADGRWTGAKKQRILDSRVGPTRRLAEAIAASGRPTALLSGSAVGFYGDRGDEELTEESAAGSGFLADVCKQWEAATEPAERAGVRVVHLRTGVVLSPKGGALAKQLPAFRAGGGAVLGDGKQWVGWIGANDWVGAAHHALMAGVRGPVNLVSPRPVTNREFGRALAKVLGRPFLMTLPRAALRVLLGEMADEALLASQKAVPRTLEAGGFAFDHAELEAALRFGLGL